MIDPRDYGINFYGDTLFTTEGFIQNHPEATEKFRQASLRGWKYAIAHPDEAIEVLKSKYKCQKSVSELEFEAVETIKLIAADQVEVGDMDLLRWGKINHHLIALGLVSPGFYLTKHFLYIPPPGIPWDQLQEWIVGIALGFVLFAGAVIFLSKKNYQLKSTQKDLVSSQNQLKEAQQLANMGSWELDLQTNTLIWSDQVYRIFGVDPQQGLSTYETFLAGVHPEDRERVDRAYWESVNNKTSYDLEHRVQRGDGSIITVQEQCRTFYTEDGTPLRSIGTVQDVTEKKRGEEVLHRYKHIISASGDLMSFVDINYVYRAANRAYLKIHQRTYDDLIDHSVSDVMGVEVFETVIKDNYDRCLAGEEIHYQHWFEYPGQGHRYMDVSYYPHVTPDNKITGVIVCVHDITELKKLQDEQLQLIQAINQMSEAIVVTNKKAEIQYVNPAFEQVSGYSASEVIGENPCMLQSGRTEPEVFTTMWKNLKSEKVWRGKLYNKKKDGSLYVEDAVISPVKDSSGKITNYIAVKRDITRELEMEEQLRQKFKMETVGVMAGGIAHNFNNNLSIILGNVDLARMQLPQHSEDVESYLENARTAVFRARDLIQNILSYSRQGAHAKAAVSVAEIVAETATLLEGTLPSTVEFECQIDEENRGLSIHADDSQLQEVLLNLCTNALHAMDEKGELILSLEGVELLAADVSDFDDISPGCFAKICVCDTGYGIPEEIRDKIFDPFFTTKGVGEGTGMGLATVQGIISQHGGVIRVQSELGVGTTFELYFPIIERRHEPRKETIIDKPLVGGTEKILFVDDEEQVVQVWDNILSQNGYGVTRMTSSTEALKLFTANPDFYDLVITDQTMPGLTGEALIQELLKIRPDIPIVLCTGYSTKVTPETSKAFGAAAFCTKPLNPKEMFPLLRSLLDK